MTVKLRKQEGDLLLEVAWAVRVFGSLVTRKKATISSLASHGFVRSVGLVVVCDDDGFHDAPERYAEGWVVTADGRQWLKENTMP